MQSFCNITCGERFRRPSQPVGKIGWRDTNCDGSYWHLSSACFDIFHDKEYFVSVINPFAIKKYAKDNSLRGTKTDKLDSKMIANYGIEKWFKLQRYEGDEGTYAELKPLGRRYRYYMELHVKALQELTHILDYVMPDIKKMFNSWNEANGKDKLSDFGTLI